MVMGGSPAEVVRRWFAAEGRRDQPSFPEDWSLEHWQRLARNHPTMRRWIAHMPRAPELVIRALARCEDWRVRHRVAMKRNLPVDLFALLAADPRALVRAAVAENPKVPAEVLAALAGDREVEVAAAARALEKKRAGRGAG